MSVRGCADAAKGGRVREGWGEHIRNAISKTIGGGIIALALARGNALVCPFSCGEEPTLIVPPVEKQNHLPP